MTSKHCHATRTWCKRALIKRKLHRLNRIDRNILRVLQKDARTSYAELARQVGLSTTPCKERVKRLEQEGVIRNYLAILDPQYLDAALVVFVRIRLNCIFRPIVNTHSGST